MAHDDDSTTPDSADSSGAHQGTPATGADPADGSSESGDTPTGAGGADEDRADSEDPPGDASEAGTGDGSAEGDTDGSDDVTDAGDNDADDNAEDPTSAGADETGSDDAGSDDAGSDDAGGVDADSDDAGGSEVGDTAEPAWPSEADATAAAANDRAAGTADTATGTPATTATDATADTATATTGPGGARTPTRTRPGVAELAHRWRTPGLIAAGVVAVLAVLYGLDLLISQGDVARGRTVAGVDVAGQSRQDAERTLRSELDESGPVELTGGGDHTLDPSASGLRIDWAATLDAATDQPLNPITRLSSLFSTEDVGLVSTADDRQLDAELERLRMDIDRDASEGTIRFDGATPVAVDPRKGRALDVSAARAAVLGRWAGPDPVELPVRTLGVSSTPETVREAIADVAKPAVSAPVTIHGEGADATVRPRGIAKALTFDVDDDGALRPRIEPDTLREVAGPQLASTENPGRDARFTFGGGSPSITPSTDGYGVDWKAVAGELPDVLTGDGQRAVTAPYGRQPAEFTTEDARGLGIKEVVGEFTTSGFAYDSGLNIKQVAKELNGAVVEPGETFSLNEFTGPRGVEQGYVAAGVISEGMPDRAVGGGISQFATTLYNAAYFAAMKDVEHKEHSYYIDRYPMGREATVFQNPDGSSVIDLKFKNEQRTGIVIQTIWTPSDITVKLWGTKRYTVDSVNGGQYNFTSPPTEVGPVGDCVPSSGSSGFSTNDTRIIKDADSGKVVRKEKRDVVYQGETAVVCPEPEPEPTDEPDDGGGGDGGDSGNDGNDGGNDNGGDSGGDGGSGGDSGGGDNGGDGGGPGGDGGPGGGPGRSGGVPGGPGGTPAG